MESKHIENSLNGLADNPIIKSFIEHAPLFVGVLDSNRKFVIANNNYLNQFGVKNLENIVGKGPGDILGCREAVSGPGCGLGPQCQYCSVIHPVINAIKSGQKQKSEARIVLDNNNSLKSLDMLVTAEPVTFNDEFYVLLFIQNISARKRLDQMEYVFFHDILNSVSSSISLLHLLEMDDFDEKALNEYFPLLKVSISDVKNQIQFHQKFKKAESGDYEISLDQIYFDEMVQNIFHSLKLKYKINDLSVRSEISLESVTLFSDKILLSRVVHNMIKNAFEACEPDDLIKIKLYKNESFCFLEVANPQVMSDYVKSQIFQRSFSTKGKNRGLGTFSMKYLSTQLLHGDVTFISHSDSGTVFTLKVPVLLSDKTQ